MDVKAVYFKNVSRGHKSFAFKLEALSAERDKFYNLYTDDPGGVPMIPTKKDAKVKKVKWSLFKGDHAVQPIKAMVNLVYDRFVKLTRKPPVYAIRMDNKIRLENKKNGTSYPYYFDAKADFAGTEIGKTLRTVDGDAPEHVRKLLGIEAGTGDLFKDGIKSAEIDLADKNISVKTDETLDIETEPQEKVYTNEAMKEQLELPRLLKRATDHLNLMGLCAQGVSKVVSNLNPEDEYLLSASPTHFSLEVIKHGTSTNACENLPGSE